MNRFTAKTALSAAFLVVLPAIPILMTVPQAMAAEQKTGAPGIPFLQKSIPPPVAIKKKPLSAAGAVEQKPGPATVIIEQKSPSPALSVEQQVVPAALTMEPSTVLQTAPTDQKPVFPEALVDTMPALRPAPVDRPGPIYHKIAPPVDQEKLTVAKQLTDWLQNKLMERKAIVAVVSRKGGRDLKGRDRTGMAHSGLAVYDPRVKTWILYQVLNNPKAGQPTAELWRMAPLDFFYGQTGYDKNALVLIPDRETQQRVYESILNGKAWKMAFTKKYNLLSRYDSADSMNCNKWILLTIAAARSDEYEPLKVLSVVSNGFSPGKIRLSFFAKEAVKRKTNIRTAELPTKGAVETVTAESLYDSGLFEEKHFVSEPI
ncbi:MAG: DUF2145 domain-containing protein [Candidatus Melainabacteria bacterium]|nr:DUF2145 domain-containing protein [Candidatus Melainabacteria bacterium]